MAAFGQLRRALVPLSLALVMGGCAGPAEVTGLRPLYPEASTGWTNVDSLQPTLRWEEFPRPADSKTGADELRKRLRNVTYDLRIWRGDSLRPLDLVYERTGLAVPEHKLAMPLTAASEYFWTIRARFEIDGNPRVLEWGARRRSIGVVGEGRRSPVVPSPFFYRFKTRSEG